MKRVVYSTKAKKDLKKYRSDPLMVEALLSTLQKLANGEPLPASYKTHILLGQYHNCLECHIGNDFLLIWMDEDTIKVVRIGTHSELFG